MRRSHSLPIHHEFVKHSFVRDNRLHCVGSTSTRRLLGRGKHEKAMRWMMSSDESKNSEAKANGANFA
jgi:hypothetical protein